MEFANIHESGALHAAARAPLPIRRAINRNRREAGLLPIPGLEERVAFADPSPPPYRGPCVWVDPAGRLGRLAGVPRGARRLEQVAPATVTRVLLVADCGTAPPSATGRAAPEKLCRGAFGTAAELNRSPGWSLRDTHEGALPLAFVGPRLRAIDCPAGLAIEWLPDLSRHDHADAVRAIERGDRPACSVAFSRAVRKPVWPHDVILTAVLQHVALVDRGAYPGAVARVYRDRPAGEEERARQIAEVSAAALRAAARADGR
jgi:hypothetical protein